LSGEAQTYEFQAEARQLLRLMIHSIYSDKDVFLRELVSNASDALDKLRLAAQVDKDLEVDTGDLHVRIQPDAAARTLTVADNGIGMSRDEVVELIGTIARSGTAELVDKLRSTEEGAARRELIGQFGIGFYAAFMVADRVSLVTRRAGESTGTRWESTGDGTYTIADVPDAPQGTAVTLTLKPVDEEDRLFDYTDPARIKDVVKRYSDFIAWPIRLADETVNSMKALWARPRAEVTDEEYHELYKHLSHDWTDPLEVVHTRAEGTFEYEALLFIPARAPFDLYQRDGRRGLQLYVKRVLIMDGCDALLPAYLRFVRGVVDAQDLSLNISREILQRDRHIELVRRRLTRKILASVKELMADEQRYATFWREFGRAVKEGLLDDADNRTAILEIASFASTADPERLTTLDGYVERMKEGQGDIFYALGESRAAIEGSPHLEALRAKGYEVLLLTDPVDEVWVEVVGPYGERPLRSVAKGEIDLGAGAADEADEQRRQDFGALLDWLGSTLSEQVKQVRLTTRLTTSPACLVGDAHDMTPALERMYRAMGQPVPQTKRVLELNSEHPLVVGLRAAYEKDPADPTLPEAAELVYGTALIAEGGELPDPARFAKLVTDRLARSL
jgi:molecular chaperone HtpG